MSGTERTPPSGNWNELMDRWVPTHPRALLEGTFVKGGGGRKSAFSRLRVVEAAKQKPVLKALYRYIVKLASRNAMNRRGCV